jgi:hypothetical protein
MRARLATALLELLAVVALVTLTSCRPYGPWLVKEPVDPLVREQALGLAAAAERVAPNSWDLGAGGDIIVKAGDPELGVGRECFGAGYQGPKHITGCAFAPGVYIEWPHPGCTAGESFAECSALAHELGHVIDGSCDQGRADAWALLIIQEWRKGLP